jgi:hypothetical protein
LKTAKLFHVNISNFIKFKKEFKDKKEIFIIVCNHYYQEYKEKFLKTKIEPVFFLNQFEEKEDLFLYYHQQCITIDKNQQFRISDIIVDFNIFLDRLKLPNNIINKKELHQLIHKNLQSCCSLKYIYNISLKNYNKETVCLEFFNSQISRDNSNLISLNQLYFFFEKWFREQNILYNCPMKSDLKLLMNSKGIEMKEHYYRNIKLAFMFDKKKICNKFKEEYIDDDNDKKLLLLDLKSQFDIWYQSDYSNYPVIDLPDLKYYMSLILKKYDPNIFGWIGFHLKN